MCTTMPFYLVLVIKPKALELLGKCCPLNYIEFCH